MTERGDFVVGITTYLQHECANMCIASILESDLWPSEISVVDNSGTFEPRYHNAPVPITVHRAGRNLGCAGGWNFNHRLHKGRDLILTNDDVQFGRDTLRALVSSDKPFAAAMAGRAWSCFLQRECVWDSVGEYDNNIWPVFWEDTEYAIRMRKAGWEVSGNRNVVQHAGVRHSTSKGSQGSPGGARFGVNQSRLASKWGTTEIYGKAYDEPWNGRVLPDWEYWYEWNLMGKSDIQEHLPRLRSLASECSHIVEFGARGGRSATAFIAAQPDKFVTYDIRKDPEFDNVYNYAGKTIIEFRRADSAYTQIEPTDMLFIDSSHCYAQTSRELRNHAAVRKYIVLHDTTLWDAADDRNGSGVQGKLGNVKPDHAGVMTAVRDFLANTPEWQLKERHTNNNGLTVLERVSA